MLSRENGLNDHMVVGAIWLGTFAEKKLGKQARPWSRLELKEVKVAVAAMVAKPVAVPEGKQSPLPWPWLIPA